MKKVLITLSVFCFAFSSFIQIETRKSNEIINACSADLEIGKAIDSTLKFTLSLNGKTGGLIDTAEIARWDSFVVVPTTKDSKEPVNYHVVSYKCIMQRAKVALVNSGTGNKINPEIKSAAMNCTKGQLIIFYDLVVTNEKNEVTKIQSGPTFRVQ